MLSGSTSAVLRRWLEPTLVYVVIIIFKLRFSGKVLITCFCILNFWHHHNFTWLYWIMFYWLFPLNSHQHHFELHNSIIGNQLEIILLEIPYCCQLEIILPEIPYCCPKIKFWRKQLILISLTRRSFDCAKIICACISSILEEKVMSKT